MSRKAKVTIHLDDDTLGFLKRVARLSDTKVNTVINVLTAIHLIKVTEAKVEKTDARPDTP
jgi:hypothetical protein